MSEEEIKAAEGLLEGLIEQKVNQAVNQTLAQVLNPLQEQVRKSLAQIPQLVEKSVEAHIDAISQEIAKRIAGSGLLGNISNNGAGEGEGGEGGRGIGLASLVTNPRLQEKFLDRLVSKIFGEDPIQQLTQAGQTLANMRKAMEMFSVGYDHRDIADAILYGLKKGATLALNTKEMTKKAEGNSLGALVKSTEKRYKLTDLYR